MQPRGALQEISKIVIGILGLITAWVVNILFWSLYIIFSIITWKKYTDTLQAPLARQWARAVLWALGVRVVSQGDEVLKGREARIVVVNHQSALDLMWPALHFPSGAFAIGKKEIAYIPFFNLMWWASNCKFIDRKKGERALRQLEAYAEEMVRKKLTLYIAPEGTRSKDGSILPFKKGAFHIALKSKAMLIPVVSYGGAEILPKNTLLSRPGVLRVCYLQPIDTSNWRPETLNAHIAEVRRLMVEKLSELQSAAQNC